MTIFSSLFMIIIVLIVIESALSVRVDKKRLIIFPGALILNYILFLYLIPEQISSLLYSGLNILLALIAPLLIFRCRLKKQLIYLTALTLGTLFIIGSSVLWIVKFDARIPLNVHAIDLLVNSIILIICIIVTKKGLLGKIFQSISLMKNNMKAMLLITIWISASLAMLLSFFSTIYSELPGFTLISALIAIFIILVGVMCPLLILNSLSNVHYKNLSAAMEAQVQAQVTHYEAMVKINEDLRHFQHDYRNLRLGLENHLKRQDIQGALSYLKSDEMAHEKYTHIYETGNVILDALLSEKQLLADAVEATIGFDGILPGNFLSTADICIIFGNALDNAIDACAVLSNNDNKTISIKSSHSHGFLFICIKNPVSADIKIKNNNITTTKEDKSSHGIGLHSIRTVVKKYSGNMNISCTNGVFCLEIDLDFNLTAQIE